MIAKDDVAKAKKVLRDLNKNMLPDEQLSFRMMTAQGEQFDGSIDVSKATLKGEQCAQFVINLPSVDPEVEKELFEIKNKDLLTKFFNRSYFHELLADDIDQARSRPGDSLLMIGVDDERALEKELGIGNFDLFIANVAEFLQRKFGEDSVYCRYNDALFVIKISTNIEKAEKAANKMAQLITEQIFNAGDTSTNCTVSIAVTQLTQQSESVNNVIKTLTDLIENMMKEGGNQVAVFDPAEEEKQARAASQAWIDRITGGLEKDRFVLHFQPVVNIDGDDSQSFECLVRLKSDDDQLIYPQQFIPVAIKYGFINDIDRRVLSKSIEAIKQADFDATLFVKVSSESLTDSAFPGWLADQLKQAGVSGQKLALEIKESELVTHATKMKPIIKAIKALNCKIVVEKFGSGLNSFSILKHFPVDLLKIDSAFMTDLVDNEDTQEKVKSIVQKAHNQGKQVICEFIEDANNMSVMWKMSVNFIQGNFIGEPTETMEPVE